jgi:VRR-NUC domain-containing protein
MSSRTHRQLSEQAIQRAVFEHLRARGTPGVFAFAVPNGGYRSAVEAAILKGTGVVAGVPDVFIVHAGRCFAIELKAEGGRASDKQLACITALREAGAFTCIAEGLDRALACLEAWGILRGRSQ